MPSIRKKITLPKLTIDGLELYEPKKINTLNEMIVECEELEENEEDRHSFKNIIKKRQRMDDFICNLQKSEEVKSNNLNNLVLQSERSRSVSRGKHIIVENQEEYSNDSSD